MAARWYVAAWAPWYGPGGQGDAAADLAACGADDALPLCLVALDADGTVLGTAALRADSVGREHGPGPWLAALLVDEARRGQGIGTALVAATEDAARRLGFTALYVSTDTTHGLFRRRGWQAVGDSASLRGAVTVYRLALG